MRMGSKLFAGYFIVASFAVLVGYLGLRTINAISRAFDKVATDTVPEVKTLEELRFAGLRIVSSVNEYSLKSQAKKSDEMEREEAPQWVLMISGSKTMDDAFKRYDSLTIKRTPDEEKMFALIKERGDMLRKTGVELFELIKGRASSEKLLERKKKFAEAEKAFLQVVNAALEFENKELAENKETVNMAIASARHTITLVALLTFSMAILCGVSLSVPFLRRISRLQAAVEKIGKGDLDTVIAVNSRDEVGALATSFNNMVVSLKHSRDDVIAARNFLNDIIHSMMDALIVVTPDGMIQNINGAACSMLGYDEEPVGQPFVNILAESPFDELMDNGFICNVEKTYRSKNGREIPVSFSGSIMWNADFTVRGIVCVAQDITERKRAEEALRRYSQELKESNEELKNFAYIVSHDLRAPLVNIKGFSGELNSQMQELITRFERITSEIDERERERIAAIFQHEVPEALDFINSSVARMDAQINAILKLSRLGRRDLVPDRVNMEELAHVIMKTLTHQLEQRNVRVTVEELPEVFVDRISIEQIVGNLLDNAVKYLEPGRSGMITLRAEQNLQETIFHIRDNGRGIAEEDLGKVFEIFRRVGPQDVPGEGMGLAYVKSLIRRLGGRIWCESEQGAGSTFSFSIPVTCRY